MIDPRTPEKIIPYIDEIKKKYNSVIKRMDKAASNQEINSLEREGVAYVNELIAVVPRLQEALIVYSASARRALIFRQSRVNTETEKIEEAKTQPKEERPVEKDKKPAKKPSKKATKKTTKKAEK